MTNIPNGSREPLAIIGIGCRLPGGVQDPASYWDLLMQKRSGIVEVPPDRWNNDRFYHPDPSVPGRVLSRWGGFVDGIRKFDPKFWGISPREAARMDPQQRWLLEVAWESLEDAGIRPSDLEGSATGVFVGVSSNDYGSLQLQDFKHIDVHTNSGGTLSIASNRISFLLDLKGPSMSVDTACSSALTATVIACQQLWEGKCTAALAGGVNALITPHASIGFSKASMLSPSGQCFAFDSRADGYVRSEGAGMIVIKRLEDALREGHDIYAVIRSAVANQDGHTSSMTVPGVESQAAMLREACQDACVDPLDVGYIEAHGTGTPVGDPIEARAIGSVLGQRRPLGQPCLIGSVKPNIGHLESGSGIAGLIKTALVVHHGVAPPNINFESPNPNIPFADLGLKVVEQATETRDCHGRVLAAINSFGFGGANADLILESAPSAAKTAKPAKIPKPAQPTARFPSTESPERPYVLPISARDPESLRGYARAYRELLTREPLAELCWSAAERKERHAQAVAAIGRDPRELRDSLNDFLQNGEASERVAAGAGVVPRNAPVSFVFTGQGAQWWAMGQQLLDREPLFRSTVEEMDAKLAKLADWSLLEEMTRDEESSRINRTDIAQPAIFALQVGLAQLWKSWGIEPARVVGHSVGEVAAAYVAGIYSLDDAVTIIYHRSRLQNQTGGHGGMLAVGISATEAMELIGDDLATVQLAAVNSPEMVTIAGDTEPLARIEDQLEQDGTFVRRLRVNYAFHTHQMEPIREELLETLAEIKPRPAKTSFISTVTGGELSGERLDADYWWRNVRYPVLFAPAIRNMARAGDPIFLELGPHPALKSSVAACLDADGHAAAIHFSLQRKACESFTLAQNAAGLHMSGASVDWQAYNRAEGQHIKLPRYPWLHDDYWADQGDAYERVLPSCHPLLGIRIVADNPTWEFSLDPREHTYIGDHRLWDSIVFPGAGYGEMGLAIARELFPEAPHAVEDLQILKALFVTEEKPPTIRVSFREEDKSYRVYSEPEERDGVWELHAEGRLVAMDFAGAAPVDLDEVKSRQADHLLHEQFYGVFTEIGFQFGPDFQHIREAWRTQGESLARIQLSENVAAGLGDYVYHPALMDAGFQASWSTMVVSDDARPEDFFYLPSSVRRVRSFTDNVPEQVWMLCRLRQHDGKSFVADILMLNDEGQRIAEILGFEATMMDRGANESWHDSVFAVPWQRRRLLGSRLQGPNGIAPASDLLRAVDAIQQEVFQEHRLDVYYGEYSKRSKDLVDRLIENAMLEIGWPFADGVEFSFAEAVDELGIAASQQRLMHSQLRALAASSVLQHLPNDADPQGALDRFVVLRQPQTVDVEQEFAALEEAFPEYEAELDLLRASAPFSGGVLTGDLDPVELMFPGGSSERLDRFYAKGGDFVAMNTLVQTAVAAAVKGRPPRRSLKVLEVGAGTGSLTASVIKALPQDDCEYLFTDIGPAFVSAAKTNFGEHSFMEFRTYDVEREPEEQQLAPGSCDLVLASNVLHATRDLRQTLANLHRCLAPGGMLMFVDVVDACPKWDNVFGLLKGWWLYEDTDLRKQSALLSPPQWKELMVETGFEFVDAFSTIAVEDNPMQLVFLGRKALAETKAPVAETNDEGAVNLVFADHEGLAATAAAAAAKAGGERTVLVRPGAGFEELSPDEYLAAPDCADSIGKVLDAVGGDNSLEGIQRVLHAWSLDHPDAEGLSNEAMQSAQRTGALSGLALVQAMVQREESGTPPVFFVTRQAQGVGEHAVEKVASAPLIGLARVANSEHPNFVWKLIDLGASASTDAADLADELRFCDADLEAAYRDGYRCVRRAERIRIAEIPQRRTEAIQRSRVVKPYRLQTDKPGVLANLSLNETPRPDPGPDEVEVRVRAGGVNFRDVMKALGIYPGNPIDLLWFGDDFAGIVERVGENVKHLRPGDEVAGMSPYIFRSHALVDRHLLFKKPPQLSFEETATLPTVFLTAHYALNELAHMQKGERILIHAGTGGVGQAAVQISKRLGLEIFATAGTDEKRQLLKDKGVHHALNSRTLDFADEIMEITNGEGVDAVLNSLAGEFIPKSFSVLAPFGRFLEIGKVDIYGNTKLGLQCLKDNISYFVIDLAQHLERKPAMVAAMFAELAERFVASDYGPLTYKVFPINEVVDAFRYMAQGKHVGKNVLSFEQPSIPVGPCTEPGHQFPADATYLITGGAGGFGLEVAKWMASQGARHLALLSRSGPKGAAVEELKQLRGMGVTIADLRVDVTSQADVEQAVDTIRQQLPPLRGVIHGAMVLQDEFIVDLGPEQFNKAVDPKMLGAWNLHRATISEPLDHFVCFSSYSAVVGAARQANYNAGNVFLDILAHHRRALGLPALTINWGALLGAGFVDRNEKTADYLEMVGIKPLYIHEAVEALGDSMNRQVTQLAAGRLDWSVIARFSPVVQTSPTYAGFVGGPSQGGGALRPRLLAANNAERQTLLEAFVAAQVAGVFGVEAADVDRDASLSDLGLDSLMAVELMNRVESELGMKVPMGKVLSGPSTRELATALLELVGDGEDSGGESGGGDGVGGFELAAEVSRFQPLTASQRRRIAAGQVAVCSVKLTSDQLSLSQWQAAVDALAARQPLLGASLDASSDPPLVDFGAERAVPVEAVAAGTSGPAFAKWLTDACAKTQRGDGALRLSKVTSNAGDSLLVACLAPWAGDAAAAGVLMQQLLEQANGKPSSGDARHYQHYMQWEAQATSEQMSRSLGVMRESLRGAPTSLALDALDSKPQSGAARVNGSPTRDGGGSYGRRPLRLDGYPALDLQVAAAQHGVSPTAVIHAALAGVLHGLTGQRDILVGGHCDGRAHNGLRRAVGPLSRSLPVRTQILAKSTWADLLAAAAKSLQAVREHQHVPADMLSHELGCTGDIEAASKAHIVVWGEGLSDSFAAAAAAGVAGATSEGAEAAAATCEAESSNGAGVVQLAVAQQNGEYAGWWRYDDHVLSDAAVKRLDELFTAALRQLAAAPQSQVLDSLPLSVGERAPFFEGEDRIPGEPEVDFAAEAALDEEVRPPAQSPAREPGPERVLLTGATGFLGAFLLDELLRNTDATVICLVRADDPIHALKRIHENLAKYELDPPGPERIVPVAGDLDQAWLGLSEDEYERLSLQVDTVYHNAALVNLALPYRSMLANVSGVRNMLAFACHTRRKRLHYVSTFTVHATNKTRGKRVHETDPLPDCGDLLHGYAQTKWVSEQLVREAERRGIEATIYRPGHITGDSRTGVSNTGDLLHTIVLSSAQLGLAPVRDADIDITPVDYVARAIVTLAQRPDSAGAAYHLTNPHPLPNQTLNDWIVATGLEVQQAPYSEWRDRYVEYCSQDPMLQAVAELVAPRILDGEEGGSEAMHPVFDTSNARAALADAVVCPPADGALLETYVGYVAQMIPRFAAVEEAT